MSKKKEIKALQESIKHWERMRDDPECEDGPSGKDCNCCTEFSFVGISGGKGVCGLCPVYKRTGKNSCIDTPYWTARVYYNERGPSSKMFKRWAQKEIDFLNEVLEAVKKCAL